MTNARHRTVPFLLTLAVLSASAALAADTTATEPRNEIVVFGGISLLDATRSSDITFVPGSYPDIPGFPGMGGRPPISVPEIDIMGETSLGSSALFGARYSRRIKDRLAVEADLSIAPSHALESRGQLCVAGRVCVNSETGMGDGRGRVGDRRVRGFLGRDVTAWQYGAGLAYEITGGDVRPFVTLGAGAATWDGAQGAETDFELRFGAGLKVLFGHVGARVDVMDHLVLDQFLTGKTEHDVQATAGLLVGF